MWFWDAIGNALGYGLTILGGFLILLWLFENVILPFLTWWEKVERSATAWWLKPRKGMIDEARVVIPYMLLMAALLFFFMWSHK